MSGTRFLLAIGAIPVALIAQHVIGLPFWLVWPALLIFWIVFFKTGKKEDPKSPGRRAEQDSDYDRLLKP